MSYRHGMAAALGLLWLLSCIFSVQTVEAQALAEPVLALRVEPNLVPLEALRGQLEAELGVRIADAETAAQGIPTLDVHWVSSGNVAVELSSRSLPRATREFTLSAERPEERVETVALIAANLVRNEAAALLPDLRPLADPGQPVAAPLAPPKKRLLDPCKVQGDAVFGIDFAPGVGASSTRSGREATRRVSLGFAGTLSSRLHGLGFSIGANIQRVSVCGAQVAVGANLSFGPVQGMQVALVNLARGKMVGVQSGIANLTEGDLEGWQPGILNVTTGYLYGAQGGIANYIGGAQRGAQGGIANYIGGSARGAQGGIANFIGGSLTGIQGGVASVVHGELTGLQGGVFNLVDSNVHGAQLGIANIAAGDVKGGTQLGVVNVAAGEVRGLQLGVFNYADRSTASIGLLSLQRHGITSLDLLGAAETGTMTVGVTHGGKYVHNSYGVGLRVGTQHTSMVVTYALGVRVASTSLLRVDIDAIGSQFITNHMSKNTTATGGLRVPVTFMLWRGLGLVAAPTYQVMITDDKSQSTQSVFGHTKIHSGSTRVLGYPGLTFGLRYESDHGA